MTGNKWLGTEVPLRCGALWLTAWFALWACGSAACPGDDVARLACSDLASVSGGGILGNCCVIGNHGCAGVATGCQQANSKCTGPNDCPLANQQIKQALRSRYPLASCSSATGSMGTVNLQPITCYNTITCVQGCTKKTYYWYCNAGINPQPGPQSTPTQPDNTVCPPE